MSEKDLFLSIKDKLLEFDPVAWSQKYLTLDGKPYRIQGNGYRPFADLVRLIGVKSLERNSKPIVISKSRQVGLTTTTSVLEMYFLGSGLFGKNGKPPIRIIHAFPTLEVAASYSKTKFNAMVSASIQAPGSDGKKNSKSYMQSLLDKSSDFNDSMTFKQFAGGNHIFIESVGIDGDRLRGKTIDILFFDECQDMSDVAISNTTKTALKAQYGALGGGVQVYFGTPKMRGSAFHHMWQSSSQQYYYLGCEKCKDYFPLYTPGSDDWEKIWIREFIVKCTKCGHEQDKRDAAERGKWVATKNPDECSMIGFHINQLYMPDFTKEKMLAEKPGLSPVNSERSYQNEVLGEFFQGETSPITAEELRLHCGDTERKFRARIESGEESLVVLGIDYGGRNDIEQIANPGKVKQAGKSYTTAVVMSVSGANLLSIDFATKFKQNDMEYKKGLIDQIMRTYSVDLAIGDIGYSEDFSHLMHQAYGDKYLVSRASGTKIIDNIKFNKDAFPKEIIFQRDHYIMEIYEQLKKGQIKFPYRDYEKIAWLVQHCCNMEIKPTISRMGDPQIHYIKSGPNDGFMALLNAYLAYKFYKTNGFSIRNPNLIPQTIEKVQELPMILGRVKRQF